MWTWLKQRVSFSKNQQILFTQKSHTNWLHRVNQSESRWCYQGDGPQLLLRHNQERHPTHWAGSESHQLLRRAMPSVAQQTGDLSPVAIKFWCSPIRENFFKKIWASKQSHIVWGDTTKWPARDGDSIDTTGVNPFNSLTRLNSKQNRRQRSVLERKTASGVRESRL